MANGKAPSEMGLVSRHGLMVPCTRVNGVKIKPMGKVSSSMLMVIVMKANG